MSDQAGHHNPQWLAPLLQTFLQRHGLQDALLTPLTTLVEECMLQMSEVLPADQLAQLAAKADWTPVLLAPQAGMDPGEQLKTLEFPDDFDIMGNDPAPTPNGFELPPSNQQLAMAVTYDAMLLPEEIAPPAHPPTAFDLPKVEEESTTPNSALHNPHTLLSSKLPRYTKQDLIAIGGMGQIWRVYDKDLNRTLAMKMLQEQYNDEPELLSRFITEAQITAQLDHPGVIPIYEFGRLVDGQFYYTMKEVKGRTLGEAIEDFHETLNDDWYASRSWNLQHLLDVFVRLCRTIEFAHSMRVVHRDLKPDNILLGEHGEVFLLDWGLAKLLKPEAAPQSAPTTDPLTTKVTQHTKRHSTQPGDILGTPSYMAPEQMLTPHKVDARSDVYSLGAIFYEILAGTAPFIGTTAEEVLYQMMMGPPPPPGHSAIVDDELYKKWRTDDPQPTHLTANPPLPDGLMELCAKAMDRKPDQRFQRADAFADAIDLWRHNRSHTND